MFDNSEMITMGYKNRVLREKGKFFTADLAAKFSKQVNRSLTPSDVLRVLDEVFGLNEEHFDIASDFYVKYRD